MTFKPEISIGDIITAASFLVAAIALFLTFFQLARDSVRKRAEFIVSVLMQFLTDPETSKVFYQLEYDDGFQYGPEFHGSEQERHIDRLLGYFERIALLYKMRVLSRSDLELVRYYFVRVFQHDQMQEYFQHLDDLSHAVGVSGCTFSCYREVASTLENRG
jgi:hypothetical protein